MRLNWAKKVTHWMRTMLLAIGFALAASKASAAVQQDLFGFHIGMDGSSNLATGAPQVDRAGNLISLFDFDGQTHLLKISPNGITTIWDVTLSSIIRIGTHIVLDANDNVYVNSFIDDRSQPCQVVVTKINANGSVAWGPKSYKFGAVNSSERMQAGPMALAADGSLYVLGHAGQSGSPQPTALFRIDSATGAEKSTHRDLPVSSDFSEGMDQSVLATDSAGNVYYGGPEGLSSFSADLKTSRWSSIVRIMPRSIVVDSASSALFVTGVGSAGNQTYNMFVSRLSSSTGATAWTWSTTNEVFNAAYTGNCNPCGQNSDKRGFGGNKIVLDSSGQVYAAGHGIVSRFEGGVVAKFDRTTGANQWWQTYGTSGVDGSIYALAIDNMSQIYVAGHTPATSSGVAFADLKIIASSGGTLWTSPNFAPLSSAEYSYEAIDHVIVDGNGNTYWKASYYTPPPTDHDPAQFNEDVYQFRGNAVSDGTYLLAGLNSGMALDNPGSSHNAGTQMDQWTINNGANQKWALTNLSYNTVRLVNQASGMSLGVRGGSTSSGAAVEQNNWTGATSQQWTVVASGSAGYFTLKNVKSGQVLDVIGASKTAGTLIDQWPSNGGANQKWRFQ